MTDDINNPQHYSHNALGIECIDAIQAALSSEEFEGFLKGNMLKYTFREKYKGGTKDISKCVWYANKLLSTREENNK